MTYFRPIESTGFNPDPKSEPKEKKKQKPIKPLSKKREKQNKIYLTIRKVFLENHPNCEVKLEGCTKIASEIHHAEKRTGHKLTDIEGFVAICRNCHIKVENQNLKIK